MNIYNFVNSKDIRKHLREIGYQFTPMQAAWLIWQHRGSNMEKKHAAWKKLIQTMPDLKTDDRTYSLTHVRSLHEMLRRYMEIQNRHYEMFTDSNDSVYMYFAKEFGEHSFFYDPLYAHAFYSYGECKSAMQEHLKKYPRSTFEVVRLSLSDRTVNMVMFLDSDLKSKGAGVLFSEISDKLITSEEHSILHFFPGMWLAFPTPFKKGDILKAPYKDPFVLSYISAQDKKTAARLNKNGDGSDMCAWGYFQRHDTGDFYYECMHAYMDLEYYKGPFSKEKRALKTLSSFLKNDIDISLYSLASRRILAEKQAQTIHMTGFTDEGLLLAGIDPKKTERKIYESF